MLQSYRAVPVFSPALCLFCALLLFPFFFCNQANATAVGSIQGSISVSPSGAGRYSVPLVIPPGIGAMQPELSLEYDSRSGNGLLGVGWSLGGLSSIRRCPATLAQDGFIDPVDYDNNDRFCLDGQRLIEAGTTGCAGGTEFRTEIDSYARICSFGVRGSGPASFRVWTKSGQVIDYGTSTDSRVDVAGRLDLAAWAINRISDTVGNAVRYVYTGNKNDGSHKLTRIRYAENLQAGMNAVTAIELRYEQRPDAETGYAGAVRTTIAERLSSVVVRVAGKTVSRYRLEYAASAVSGRSMLSRITHCDAVNKCAEPLELGWQTGEQLLKYSGQGSGGTHAYWDRVVDDSTYKGRSFTGDFNGDGRTDLMMVYRDPNLDEVSIYHWHADASGKLVYAGRGVGGTHAWWNKVIDSDKYRGHSFTGDYNGDGRTDLVMIYRDPGLDRVSIYHWHADESGKLYYAGKGSGGTHAYWNTVVDSGKFKGRVFSGDFNGDGRTDLTMVYRDPNRDQVSIYHWHAGTNGKLAYAGKGSGGTHAYWNQVLDSDTYRGQTFSGDFNADGQTDLVMVYRDPKLDQVSIHHWHADKKGKLYYAGKGVGGTHAYWDRVVGSGKFKGKTFVGDFNGDGQSDLMMTYRDPNLDQVSIYHWHAMENGRLGYAGKGIGAVHAYWNKVIDSDTYQGRAFTGDFNGDGKTDLSMVYRDPNLSTVSVWHWQAQPTGKLKYVGRGSGGESARWHQVVDSGKYRGKAHVGDFNGDGKSDLMLVYRDPGQSRVAIHHWGMNRRKTDLLVSIDRHNTGKVEKFSYGFLTDAALYSKAGDAKYPEIDLQIALPVVKTMQVSDGIGGLRTSEYLYQGLKADQHGRGLLGFRKSSVVDRQSDIVTSTSYHQSFPLTGRRKTSDSRLEGAARPFSKTAWTWRKVPLNSGSRYEVQAVSAVESSYEVDGSLVSTVNTEYQAYGKFGNVLRMAVTTSANGNSYTRTTVNYFAKEDPSAWVLGRLTRSEVTSSTPGDSGTRTSDFDYDVVTGLLTSEVIEPDNPDLKLRTEYGYDDGYGNRTSIVERGSGNARYRVRRRISTTAHDYADLLAGGNTYKVVSTNTRGHTGTRVYDLRFGVVRSHIGINGLTTSWNYDGFGRRIRERRADGTETTWQRAWCSSACPSRAVYKIVSRSSGSPTVTRYFDMLDRQVRVKTGGFQGRAILHDTEYDKLGRISRESRNYFDGDPRFWTKYRYDELGRVLRVSSPDGGVEEIDYQGLVTVVRKFDRNGDYDQSVTRKTNALGEEIKVIDPAGQALSKHYDAFGNLVKTVDAAGNSTLLRYDLRGNRISMDDPDMGYWRYRYDALGQLRWQKDALGQVVEMEYDLLGRLVRRTEPEGLASWSYDTAENGLGKLHRVTAEDGYERVLSYDAMGRKFSDRRRMNGSWYEMRTRYDHLGRPNKLVYPGGFRLKYGYDNKGYLVSAVNDRLPDEVFWKAGDFDADGNVVLASLGNGLQTVRLYEPFSGRVRGISTGRGASSDIQFATYRFDSLGNLRKRVDQNRKRTEEFSYDERNRLVNAAVAGVESSGYVYDDLGNIKRKGLLSGYRYGEGGAGPHALTRAGGRQYSYDRNGNMVQGAGRTIVWSSFNKPLELSGSAAKLEFGYGPDRARYIQRKSSGSTVLTLYFDKHYEKVSAGGVTEHRYYIYAAGRAVALYTESGDGSKKTRYLHQDHLGSTEVITDELGNEIERLGFTAFGKHTVYGALTDGVVQPLVTTTRGFTGHELLGEFDLIHMNGRVYDPHTGRFLSADPQVQFPGNMQSYNRYSYVHNNPLSYTDPSGFGIWSKVKKAVKRVVKNDWARLGAGIVAANVVSPYVAGYFGLLSGSSTVSAVANGVAGGLALGGITAGNATGALRGGLQGGAFGFVGHASVLDGLRSSVPGGGSLLHGAVGGTFQTMAGESFREGFLGAAATKFSNTNIFPATNNAILGSVRSVVAGGLGAQLGGGKFLNGATTGAFSYLFNDAFGKIQMRRVGDSLYPVRVYECATAECVARGANIDLTDSGSQAFLRASDAKTLSDFGAAVSLVILKQPVGVIGKTAASASLTADIARTVLTANPTVMIPALTGSFASSTVRTTLGLSSEAAINRVGASAGLLMNQVID